MNQIKNLLRPFSLLTKKFIFKLYQLCVKPRPNTVLFESFQGRRYACNPKALYEEMQHDPKYKDFQFIWIVRDLSKYQWLNQQHNTTTVAFESRDYYRALATAKYWIFNSRTRTFLKPGKTHILMQTWHGTPYKKIGCDVKSNQNAFENIACTHRYYKSEGKRLTYMISPSPFCTEKLASAFNLTENKEKILETGYPRNDVLFNRDDHLITELKKQLSLPLDKKIILYAPTFRDNQHQNGIGYTLDIGLDFQSMQKDLGEDYILLFRAHYFVASQFDFTQFKNFVYDISALDDINTAYLVSDLLITDYSSVFFDYANLQKPILFYIYDYENYKNELRDLYLTMDELPGPALTNQADLITAVRTANSYCNTARYDTFCQRFNPWDGPAVSKKVLDLIIN